jgi:hypothetical protein
VGQWVPSKRVNYQPNHTAWQLDEHIMNTTLCSFGDLLRGHQRRITRYQCVVSWHGQCSNRHAAQSRRCLHVWTEAYADSKQRVWLLALHFDPADWDSAYFPNVRTLLSDYTAPHPPPQKKKLHGLSPLANYTDRATAACRRSGCQLSLIEGATWSAWHPCGRILGFLDRSRYFSIK